MNIKPKVTLKRKKMILIPEVQNYIIQPNRITNAHYNYTLYQEKILTSIIYHLQQLIDCSFNNKDYRQLEMFSQEESEWFKFKIPLKHIAKPQHYEEVTNAIEKMVGLVLAIPVTGEDGKQWKKIVNFINAEIPVKGEYRSHIIIQMNKDVARHFVEIEKNEKGFPVSYTRFMYEIAINASNKYTSRIYKLISSWKKKGGFIITLPDLKEKLGIMDKYSVYSDFKKRVLLPVHEELFEKADCWFNCKDKDFEKRDGKTVTHLNFKVITPKFLEEEQKKTDYIINLLKMHLHFTDSHIDKVRSILYNKSIKRGEILEKITFVNEKLYQDTSIKYPQEYAIKAILSLQN